MVYIFDLILLADNQFCTANECFNGGACTTMACQCIPGFAGSYCETGTVKQ